MSNNQKQIEELNDLKNFKSFMSINGRDWSIVSHENDVVSYQKNIQGKKGSCFIALLLLCFGLIPGILYLYFSHKKGSAHNFSVMYDDGVLVASGDSEGLKLYNKFLESKQSALCNDINKEIESWA